MSPGLAAFADEVGRDDPIAVVGGRSHWRVGGLPAPGVREVRAPAGVVEHRPDELTVRCGAGTTVAELAATLAPHGQEVALDPPEPERATVGGVLATGRSGLRRLGRGPVRDAVLEVRAVSAEGAVVVAGGPTVKNVSGYDLCRLLVGSLGTLGLIGEVVLRARPLPVAAQWYRTGRDPQAVRRALHAPSSVLWDGTATWALLEGHPDDLRSEARSAGLVEVEGPPPLPAHRWSVSPGELRGLLAGWEPGTFVAEIGVGTVHAERSPPPPVVQPRVRALHRALAAQFDPTRRLNPGRDPLAP